MRNQMADESLFAAETVGTIVTRVEVGALHQQRAFGIGEHVGNAMASIVAVLDGRRHVWVALATKEALAPILVLVGEVDGASVSRGKIFELTRDDVVDLVTFGHVAKVLCYVGIGI